MLDRKSHLQGVSRVSNKRVVVELERVLEMIVARLTPERPLCGTKTRHVENGGWSVCNRAQSGVTSKRNKSRDGLTHQTVCAVVSDAEGVHKCRAENVSFLYAAHDSFAKSLRRGLQIGIRSDLRRLIE